MAPSLSTEVCPSLTIGAPTMLASGILGISADVFARVAEAGAGAVVTKSVSREPRDGYQNPTVTGVRGGGWLNAVGLSNPGAGSMAGMLAAAAGGRRGAPVIVSLVGSAGPEFEQMAGLFEEECGGAVAAYELNLSCPHVARVGLEVGDDPALVREVVRATKGATGAPVIAKVGLGSARYMDTVEAALAAGADAITAINTVRAMSIDVAAMRPVLSNGIGGLSGPPIRPIAVRCVYEIALQHGAPVIGCGGVSCWEDAVEFMLAGASAVQVGSAVAGAGWVGVFSEINAGVRRYMEDNGFSGVREVVGLAVQRR